MGNFRQFDQEPMHKLRERLKDLLRQCQKYGYNQWYQMEEFYNGLNQPAQSLVDAAAS